MGETGRRGWGQGEPGSHEEPHLPGRVPLADEAGPAAWRGAGYLAQGHRERRRAHPAASAAEPADRKARTVPAEYGQGRSHPPAVGRPHGGAGRCAEERRLRVPV